MSAWILILIFLASMLLGYKIISNVPSLLHTPLMSGMNALSGVTLLGALLVSGLAVALGDQLLGFIAIVLATYNMVGGFAVTDRMLKMFSHEKKEGRS